MTQNHTTDWLWQKKMREKTHMSFYLDRSTFHVFTNAIRRVGSPPYVRFLINPDNLCMAMESYDKKGPTSFSVPPKLFSDSKGTSMRIQSKRFCCLLADKMGWDETKSYRVPGHIFSKQQIVIFDLSQAVELNGKESHASQNDVVSTQRPIENKVPTLNRK